MKIDQETITAIEKVLREKRIETVNDNWSIETQDDNQFLLISIYFSAMPASNNIQKAKDDIRHTISPMIPFREDDYSWMVVFIVNGNVVDSIFGGWTHFGGESI